MLTPTATGDNVPTTNVVEWVCARAAANRSVSRCKPCEWFQLDQLHRQEPSPVPSCIPSTAKLAWFVCLTPGTDELALGHLEYAQVAIMSALINAPSLAPHVMLVRLADRRDRLADRTTRSAHSPTRVGACLAGSARRCCYDTSGSRRIGARDWSLARMAQCSRSATARASTLFLRSTAKEEPNRSNEAQPQLERWRLWAHGHWSHSQIDAREFQCARIGYGTRLVHGY